MENAEKHQNSLWNTGGFSITEKKLQAIRKILGEEQEICFELGFESADEDVRAIYNKDIDIARYLEVTKLCERYRIGLQINVLLGAPFLTRREQIQDCLNSLKFIYEILLSSLKHAINVENV